MYPEREDLKCKAEKEMIDSIDQYLQQLDSNTQTADSIYSMLKRDEFITISSPEESTVIHFITSISPYDKSGVSIKPGNVVLNMRNLIIDVPSMGVEGYTFFNTDSYFLKVGAAVALWKEFKSTIEVEVTEEHAFLMVALWKNCNQEHRISIDHGLECVNELLKGQNKDILLKEKYWKLLGFLEDIKSIEIDNEVIWLREWVSRRYTESLLYR